MRFPRTTKCPKVPDGEWIDTEASVRRTLDIVLKLAMRKRGRDRRNARKILTELEEVIRKPIPQEIWDRL